MNGIRFGVVAVATTLGIATVLATDSAYAFTVYTDRTAWEAALGNATITTDTFDNVKSVQRSITFDSGVVSTGNGPGRVFNQVDFGTYSGGINGDGDIPSDIFFDTITWSFPQAIIGFGADWRGTASIEPIVVTGNFDGIGDQTVSFSSSLSFPGNGFLGIIGLAPFSSITFNTDNTVLGNGPFFYADNLSFAAAPPATPVPTPALLPGLVGMGVAAWRKRRSEVTD